MWQLLGGLAVAGAPDPKAWLDLVLDATQQDGTGASVDELRDRAAALCKAGWQGACDLPSWSSPFDRTKAVAALTPHCEAGDGVSCLVVAWDLNQREWADFTPTGRDPARALDLVKKHCAEGLKRACTEVGYALLFGAGTYVQRPAAMETFRAACVEGEPTACLELGVRQEEPERTRLIRQAMDLGSVRAHGELADDATGQVRITHLVAACDRGLGWACRELAPLEPDPLSRLEQSCRAQDDESCVLALVGSAEWGGRAVPEIADDLAALCLGIPEACLRGDLLGFGAPPVTFPTGSWPTDKDRDRLAADLGPVLFPCYVDRLTRGDVRGWIHVAAWIDTQGKVVAAAARGPMVDRSFAKCANAASAGMRSRVPDGGAMIAEVEVGLDHTAGTSFRGPPGLDAPKDYTTFGKALDELGPALDRCATPAGEKLASLGLDVVLPKTGAFKSVEFAKSTESAAVDLCARDLLRQSEMPLLLGRLKGRVTIDFLTPAKPPPIRPPAPPSVAVAPAGEALQWRVLAIVVRDNEIDGKTAAIGPHSLASIRDAHAGVEAYVREHTRGMVAMTTDLVEVDGPLTGAYERDEEGNGRWVMEPEDLTTELRLAVRPGRYHSLYVWVPIPTGFPLPYYGATFGHATVGGATISSAPVPDRAEVVVNPGLPRWYPALVGLYSQLEVRSARQLGTRLPDNEEIVRLPDGRVFDPRDWLSEDDALDWYDWAFAERLTPEIWRDLLSFGATTNVPKDGNLAATAEAVGGHVTDPWLVNDGCVDLGRLPSAAVAATEGDVWVGLLWDEPVEVGRLTVDLRSNYGDTDPSVAAIALDVADVAGVFHEIERWTALDTATVTLAIEPRTTTGVRVRVLERRDGVDPAFREIEVYPP